MRKKFNYLCFEYSRLHQNIKNQDQRRIYLHNIYGIEAYLKLNHAFLEYEDG